MFSSVPTKISLFSFKESNYFVNKDYFFLENESKIHTCGVIGTRKIQANRKKI